MTANVVARNSVTSADTKGFNQASRSQKTILPAANEFYALGIRPTEDWVRQLSGRVPNKEFASTAAGADSLRLNIKHFYMRNLPHKLQQISAYYDQNDYKENFGFLDNFIRIDRSDPVVAILDKEVESLLLANDDRLTFAAPDPFEHLNIDHCRIQYRRHADTDELDVSDVYAILDKLAVKDTRCTEYKSMPVARTAKTSHRFTTYTSIYKLNLTTTDSVTR